MRRQECPRHQQTHFPQYLLPPLAPLQTHGREIPARCLCNTQRLGSGVFRVGQTLLSARLGSECLRHQENKEPCGWDGHSLVGLTLLD